MYKTYRWFKNHGSTYTLKYSFPSQYLLDMPNCVELNQTSSAIFDYIKVLENAQELHLLDSSWVILVYLLQSKITISHVYGTPPYNYFICSHVLT